MTMIDDYIVLEWIGGIHDLYYLIKSSIIFRILWKKNKIKMNLEYDGLNKNWPYRNVINKEKINN
jgi:hypothetical protein